VVDLKPEAIVGNVYVAFYYLHSNCSLTSKASTNFSIYF
jgi:hypothetical protein